MLYTCESKILILNFALPSLVPLIQNSQMEEKKKVENDGAGGFNKRHSIPQFLSHAKPAEKIPRKPL